MSFTKWISDKLDSLIQNANIKEHQKAKEKILMSLLEKRDNEAKELFQKEFLRYQEALKKTEKNQFIINDKLSELNTWFQYACITRK
jgi:5'-deoxynucleotidase YfbR-like HD superfamily hydrolase